MSIITAGTTLTNGLILESDQNGNLIVKTGATPTTALTINSSQVVTLANALPAASGGTGVTSAPTNGQILIGNGTGYTLATLTAGSGITITNGVGSITLAAGGLPTMNIVSGTTQAATAGNQYVLTNAAATTVTLPASPAAGDTVYITVANSLTTNVVARNGSNIMKLAEDLTLNAAYAAVQLRYADATRGWVLT
jgi:hypothetical protein